MFTMREDMHGYPQMFVTMCIFGNKKIYEVKKKMMNYFICLYLIILKYRATPRPRYVWLSTLPIVPVSQASFTGVIRYIQLAE